MAYICNNNETPRSLNGNEVLLERIVFRYHKSKITIMDRLATTNVLDKHETDRRMDSILAARRASLEERKARK